MEHAEEGCWDRDGPLLVEAIKAVGQETGQEHRGKVDVLGTGWVSARKGESVMKPWQLTALRQMDTSTCDARRGHESSDAKRASTHAVDIMEGSRTARDGGCGRREAGVEDDPVRKHAWHWRV